MLGNFCDTLNNSLNYIVIEISDIILDANSTYTPLHPSCNTDTNKRRKK